MDDNSDLFYKESITLNIEDSSSQGFFSFFLSKKQVLSLLIVYNRWAYFSIWQ